MFFFFKKPECNYKGKYSAIEVAKYVVKKCTDDNCPVTDLQLQKILYYLQVEFLQRCKYALFEDDIEAWQFGPVVRSVYRAYCGYGLVAIYERYAPAVDFTQDELRLMDSVINKKRIIKPWDLVAETHQAGKPWDRVYRNGAGNGHIIPKEVIAEYA